MEENDSRRCEDWNQWQSRKKTNLEANLFSLLLLTDSPLASRARFLSLMLLALCNKFDSVGMLEERKQARVDYIIICFPFHRCRAQRP